jgi:hypothetical protein
LEILIVNYQIGLLLGITCVHFSYYSEFLKFIEIVYLVFIVLLFGLFLLFLQAKILAYDFPALMLILAMRVLSLLK